MHKGRCAKTVVVRGVSTEIAFCLWVGDWCMGVLFVLLLYVHSKQLRSCWDSQLLNHTVPGQASWRQFTSIQCPFFCQ